MGSKTVLLFFLCQTTAVLFAEETSTSRSSYFTTRENKRLKGYVIKRFDSPTLLSCGQQCIKNPRCMSTNFIKNSKGTCELNKHEIPLINENDQLHDQQGVTFSVLLKGCLMTSCLNGGSCLPDKDKQTFSCSCQLPWTGDKCQIKMEPSTCKEIYDKNLSRENRAYLLKLGSTKIPTYCHMASLGACGVGGWTLVMKINGTQITFRYNSILWSNKEPFSLEGGKTGFDKEETKLPSYWNTPFSKICLGMEIGGQKKFIAINKTANSLYSLIADGKFRHTSLGHDTWKSLIGSKVMFQKNCNREGFNVVSDYQGNWPKTRIGILGNNEDNCYTCDSRIGFGIGGKSDVINTCGNGRYSNGQITAMGYILVQ